MENTGTFTLTCKIGRFQFPSTTILSHAKLIRDAVMGQILNPNPQIKSIECEKDVHTYVNRLDDVLNGVRFTVELKPEYGGLQTKEWKAGKLQDKLRNLGVKMANGYDPTVGEVLHLVKAFSTEKHLDVLG